MTVRQWHCCDPIMGKRKQECPRKHSGMNPKDDLSEDAPNCKLALEHVVKKLKSKSDAEGTRSTGTGSPDRSRASLRTSSAGAEQPKVFPRRAQHCPAQTEPLDLRMPHYYGSTVSPFSRALNLLSDYFVPKVSHPTTISHMGRSAKHPVVESTALDLSASAHHPLPVTSSPPPTPLPSTFQQLSAKLEEYFATGIVASKFPKKMVRGQDIWMQDIEQKRAILKCLKCGASYNSLTELAKHIKKSGHHDDVTHVQAMDKVTNAQSSTEVPLPSNRISPPFEAHKQKLCPPARPVQEYRTDVTGPSAFKPLRTDQRIKTFQPKRFDRPGTDNDHTSGRNLKGRVLKYSHKFDGGRRMEHSQRRSQTFTPQFVMPAARKSERDSETRNLSSAQSDANHAMEERTTPPATLVASPECKYPMPTPVLGLNNSVNPLFALKKFLDVGIPRLKPTGIDGGRI